MVVGLHMLSAANSCLVLAPPGALHRPLPVRVRISRIKVSTCMLRLHPSRFLSHGWLSLQVAPVCHAHIPHHRQHLTSRGLMLPRQHRPGRRRPLMAPERAEPPSAAGQLADWLLTGQWKQQLAQDVPKLCQEARAGVQALCLVLAATYQQAQSVWQIVLANWPEWQASLQEDAEIVFEYALVLIPAWLAAMHAWVMRLCNEAVVSEPVQLAMSSTAAAVTATKAAALAAAMAAQRNLEETMQLITKLRVGDNTG